MKRSMLILIFAVFAEVSTGQQASAIPGERVPYRAAHFSHKVVQKIEAHVIQPVRHGIVRRVR